MNCLKLKNKIKNLEDKKNSLILSNFKLERENEQLKEKIKRLEKLKIEIERLKEPKAVINVKVTAEDLAKEVARALNKSKEKEHKCTPECFGKHVIKAIQNDYDSCPVVFKATFLTYWFNNLSAYYPWLESLYIIDEKIYFKSKESSI